MNAYDPKNDRINWQKSTRLMPGSLLLLVNFIIKLSQP